MSRLRYGRAYIVVLLVARGGIKVRVAVAEEGGGEDSIANNDFMQAFWPANC